MPASGTVDAATSASVMPRAAKVASIPAPVASPARYRNTSTTGFALYFSEGVTTLKSVSREGREMA